MNNSGRQLVALMLTDMVGYTRLSQQDERRALRLLDDHNALILVSIDSHGGRVVKGTGDGFLVEFPSALQAVTCAVEIQHRVHDRNARNDAADCFEVRIGLHVGDVVRREGDLFGDGVNIASRIEPLASPGGICLSQAVHAQVWNKMDRPLISLGRKRLKNVDVPLEVFAVSLPWDERPVLPSAELDPTRIAVLPLTSISSAPEDAYFAEGMTEELIYTLSKVRGLQVIAHTSVMGYKATGKPIREIGSELNVGSIVEGSVRTSGDRLRITVQLVDVASEAHLWSGRYDRQVMDVFEIQSEIATQVAGELRGVLDGAAARRQPTENLDAYKEYLKGRHFWARRTRMGLCKAIECFEAAVDTDPKFAKAYSGLADCYAVLANHGLEPPNSVLPKAEQAARRALAIDPDLAEAHASLGILYLEAQHDPLAAEKELRDALKLNPNYATGHHWLSLVLDFEGRLEEARREIEVALELDPLAHILHAASGMMAMEAGEYERAKVRFERARDLEPDYPDAAWNLAQAEMAMWNWHAAIEVLEVGLQRNPNNTVALSGLAYVRLVFGDKEAAEALIRRAETIEPDLPSVWRSRGLLDRCLGRTESAIGALEAFAEKRPQDPGPLLTIALCHAQRGEFDAAWAAIDTAESRQSGEHAAQVRFAKTMHRGIVSALQNGGTKAGWWADRVLEDKTQPKRTFAAALILFSGGRVDDAFDVLDDAVAVRDPALRDLPVEPLLQPYRDDPRFRRILEIMGLANVAKRVRR